MKESSEYLSHSDVGKPVQKSLMVRGREAEGQIGHPWLGTSRRWTTPHSLGEHVVWRALGSLFISPATWSNHRRGTMPARYKCGVGGSVTCRGSKGVCRPDMDDCSGVCQGQNPARVRAVSACVCVCVCMTEVSDGYYKIYQIQIRLRSRSCLV